MSAAVAAQLQATIAALEAQRAVLGDAIVETALGPLRAQLAALSAPPAPPPPPPPAEPPAQALRLVTILFLDVVGSTSLSQKLDPEETHAVMDGALERCTAVVRRHGGKVLQYAGDNLLAVFGGDEAREDDAERAVFCGLDLLAEGRALGAEVLRLHAHEGFNVRVGLHTGGVLLGGGVDAEGSIRGMAVNIAARMEQTAPAGALRISQDTYRHVRGIFEVDPQPPIAVKGIDEPIATYLVRKPRPRSFRTTTRGIEGVETRMVGRERELRALREAMERLHAERRLEMVLVVAEAGMGKSRLLDEFNRWAAARPERFLSFQGRADPRTESQPFGLLRDLLSRWLQITGSDSEDDAKAKVEAGVAPLFLADDGPELAQAHAHLLGHLIGLDFSASPHVKGIVEDPKQIRARAFHTAAQIFRRVGAAQGLPMIVELDDLHWSDDSSLEFIAQLLRTNRDVPMLLLCLTRQTLFERRPQWRSLTGPTKVELAPLDKAASLQLAGELLKRLPSVPAVLSELLIGRADGNPFFMEELVKMLADQGALQLGPERWTLNADRLMTAAVPQTLTGILQARLDGLPAPERRALQEASVVGLVFWEPALAALDAQAPAALPALVERELALPRADSSVDGAAEYGFKNHILHDVTYDTLLKRTRRELHSRAATWFAELSGVRAGSMLGAAAEHYEKAGSAAQAAEYFARAAMQAKRVYAHESTLGYVARALALLGEGADTATRELRWRLLDARERTLELQGRRPEQRADLEALAALADALADDHRRAEVAARRALLAGRSGDYHGQEALAREAMALAERSGIVPLRLNAQRLLADALARLGDVAAGEALARQGLAEARALGLPDPESRFLNTLAVIASRRNDLVAVLENSELATRLRRELGDRRNEALGLSSLGGGWLELGEFERAREALEECVRLNRAMGDHAMEPIATANLSILALWQGDADGARLQARSALRAATDVQAPDLQAFACWCAGNAELALGDIDAAGHSFGEARVIATAIDGLAGHDAAAGLARVALARGSVADALAALAPTLAVLRDGGGSLDGTLGEELIELTAYQALKAAGDPAARPLLERAQVKLKVRAARLTDPAVRERFLERVPPHRDLLAAWAAEQAAGPTSAAG